MRLWVKLAVIVGLAAGAQWGVERNAGTIEAVWFFVQFGDRVVDGRGRFDEEAMAAAHGLRQREAGRLRVAAAR